MSRYRCVNTSSFFQLRKCLRILYLLFLTTTRVLLIITQFHELDRQEGEPVQQARDERENKPPEKEQLCGSEKHSTSAEHLFFFFLYPNFNDIVNDNTKTELDLN